MLLPLLVTNLLHSAVALVFCAGLRPFAGRQPAARWSHLLGLGIALPILVPALRLIGVPGFPDQARLLRAEGWMALLEKGGPVLWIGGGVLLLGTTLIFLLQEALPFLLALRDRESRSLMPAGPELEETFAALTERFREHGHFRWARTPSLKVIEESRPLASVEGLGLSQVVVSTGLLERLDAKELEGVLAHELAHLARGGNLTRLGLWILRALQAPNPFALTLARAHFEANEAACDDLAAQITGRPAALASALMHTRNRAAIDPAASPFLRARLEMYRRSDLEATRARVEALLHRADPAALPVSSGLLARLPQVIFIAALLWSIG